MLKYEMSHEEIVELRAAVDGLGVCLNFLTCDEDSEKYDPVFKDIKYFYRTLKELRNNM